MAYTPSNTGVTVAESISRLIFRSVSGCFRVECSLNVDIFNALDLRVHLKDNNVVSVKVDPLSTANDIVDKVKEEVGRVMVDIPQAQKELLARYAGDSPNVLHHIDMAVKQLEHGQTVGERMTPVISFWLMRDKWKSRGSAWQMYQPDGDVRAAKDVNGATGCIYPDILQLAYFVTTDGLVCQLAYIYTKEQSFARDVCNYPQGCVTIENKKIHTKVQGERISPADEIVAHMGSFL